MSGDYPTYQWRLSHMLLANLLKNEMTTIMKFLLDKMLNLLVYIL